MSLLPHDHLRIHGMSMTYTETDEVVRTLPGQAGTFKSTYEAIKPAIDFSLTVLMLLPSVPLILLSIILVRLNSRGPAIYTQKRVGLEGKVFTIYKIRTMYQDSERTCGPRWCVPGDPRVTPVGRFLRWSHLDELPQLFNILRGEMSLIGPRPERPEFVNQLERALPKYRHRLMVRPGLTGLAQVQQPPDTDLFSVHRKLNFDLYYVETMSPWLDFRLIVATVLKCLGVSFEWIGRILQLPDPNPRDTHKPSLPEPELTASSLVSDLLVR
jgi:lipopolysaccharide/colanic/teichoic acid biosynthesis glycosyltransferase